MSGAWVAPAELNIYAAAESGAALAALFADLDAGDALRVDLSQVSELDAAGLQILLATALAGRRDGRIVEFVEVPEVVQERLDMFGVGKLVRKGGAQREVA